MKAKGLFFTLVAELLQKFHTYTAPQKHESTFTAYVCTERIFDSRPFLYNKIFLKKLFCGTHLYASFGTFCVQIGQLVAAQRVFKPLEEFRNGRHFPSITAICRVSNIL